MFAKPMFSMLVWSYCVTGHLNSNGHEAAITSSAAKIGGTGKTLNESVKKQAIAGGHSSWRTKCAPDASISPYRFSAGAPAGAPFGFFCHAPIP